MTSRLWSLDICKMRGVDGDFRVFSRMCMSGKNICFAAQAWYRPESKYTKQVLLSVAENTVKDKFLKSFFFFFVRENLAAVGNCSFPSVSFRFLHNCVCISFPQIHEVCPVPPLRSLLAFPFHFPGVSFLYLSCLDQVEHAAGSSFYVGPFRNLMVSAHVYLPGSQRAQPAGCPRRLLPHRHRQVPVPLGQGPHRWLLVIGLFLFFSFCG